MSRHISGELAGIRVKSRKPPAAKPRGPGALAGPRIPAPGAKDGGGGGGPPAAKIRSWSCAAIAVTRPPTASHAPRTRSTASGAVRGVGVSTTRAPRNRSTVAASTPLVSRPAIGCPGTNRETRSRSSSSATRTTCALVLPTSVTTAPGCIASATSCSTGPIARTGTATTTRSALSAASEIEAPVVSITPRAAARSSAVASPSNPITCDTAPARRNARAKDPPMRPTPMTASVFRRRMRSTLRQRALERGEEALVVLGKAHRHAQVLRHAIARDGTHDHAFLQELGIDAGRLADAHRDEVGEGGDVLEAEALESLLELRQAPGVDVVDLGDEGIVVERGARRHHREVVHVEGLPHAIHQLRDLGIRDPVAHAKPGEPEGLRERARHDEVRVFRDPSRRRGLERFWQVLAVRLVDDHH